MMMKVMRKVFLAIAILSSIGMLWACKKDEQTDPNVEFIKYDGNYQLKSAIADQELDVNMDGKISNDMLTEVPDLNFSLVNIVVNKLGKSYRILWSEQNRLYANEPQGPIYMYNLTGVFNTFELSGDTNTIHPTSTVNSLQNEALHIQANGDLKVQLTRTLFTATGQQKVIINAVYSKIPDIHSSFN